ncbi:unnamed protein product [Hyaloperonospora brassicae]|uniref:J domain-containing protein n=1 Tax=Hyaloperonospora brassicae TaxID=162125 RepID=A0AAV0UG36_HYABA|nr:unnamed protein product [Hyaloperonospora brassicae]
MSPRSRRRTTSKPPRADAAPPKCRRPASRKVTGARDGLFRPSQAKALPHVIDLTTAEDDSAASLASDDPHAVPLHLESTDYFTVLRLPRAASDADVRRAYRQLAVQWHPDKNRSHPRAEEAFKRISEAYEVLSDPVKRQQYEALDANNGPSAGGAAPPRDPFPCHERATRYSTRRARDMFDHFFGDNDPFAAFFGGGGGQSYGSRWGAGDPFMAMRSSGVDLNMGLAMGVPGFGGMAGRSMMGGATSDGFYGRSGLAGRVFSTTSSSSSSTVTDRNGNVIQRKTMTTTGSDGLVRSVTEEYCNGKLVNSSSSDAGSRLAGGGGGGRMQLDGTSSCVTSSYQRSVSRPKY